MTSVNSLDFTVPAGMRISDPAEQIHATPAQIVAALQAVSFIGISPILGQAENGNYYLREGAVIDMGRLAGLITRCSLASAGVATRGSRVLAPSARAAARCPLEHPKFRMGDKVGWNFSNRRAASQGSVLGFDILTRQYEIRRNNGTAIRIHEDELSTVCSAGYR